MSFCGGCPEHCAVSSGYCWIRPEITIEDAAIRAAEWHKRKKAVVVG